MTEIPEDKIIEAYHAALQYGPEPFNHERRAKSVTTEKMFTFLMDMESSDLDNRKAYHTAGTLGVNIMCVDWMTDLAEESDGIIDFLDILIEGYETPDSTGYYVCLTRKGERVDHCETEDEAIERAGELQAETGEPHHYYDSHDEEVELDT